MSEFKFACPVCGQHITAASNTSGTSIACPTCFQQIVVPQAPATTDSKLILSAAQANRPRPASAIPDLGPLQRSRSWASLVASVSLVVVLCAAAVMIYAFRSKLMRAFGFGTPPVQHAQAEDAPTNPPSVQATWTLDPRKAVIPDQRVIGRIRGAEFVCDRAIFAAGVLSVRQGRHWPPDLGIDILLSAQKAEQLSGKTIVIAPGAKSVVSKLILRWKDDQQHSQQEEITTGYALTLEFGQSGNDRLPGKMHVSVSDVDKSYVAGTFDAEIIKPQTKGK